ncbi:glycoside hydrolase family 127 protein [Sphingomonas sp. KR1UV-12]|uniref:Glycoside hydrolase family 127 protein n=1 Tax=Sphingomonas aurea TaxID=3063994 RepID=A0ABT9EM65_9SPHN|nr:glycoside hydrolase family 127 protein [Sphingomonas sp. KR1UV-12]MDP1027950.1 glycoside hydrolase family 127 protein [Sphingomonas sp. KR1UV-12]
MSGATLPLAALPAAAHAVTGAMPLKAEPFPLSAVRLRPSDFAHAVEVNRAYLLRLEPDRLLHNFHAFAGLPTKAKVYGGWESDTIAGHTLGHYLSGLALTHAQIGCTDCAARAAYIIDELAACQAKNGDGYVAGFTRKRKDGTVVDGKEIFPEIMRGDIRSAGFDLNGCWVPLYNWHKMYTGLFDVIDHIGPNPKAMAIMTGLGGYIDRVFAALSDDQVQTVLACEHGGINESFAELHARTGDPRWLKLAERIYHKKVLVPLSEKRDELANIHANTQVPKLIGLARLYEITGEAKHATAARFFWEQVTRHHSYVIGGNADREYFTAADTTAQHITDQTCESCNTYNMLKLTRHLYAWQPDGALFDFYERAHLNHIMAHQEPVNGGFTYMMPLMTGTKRAYSAMEGEEFWCCVGTGMESHAKHGESIFWQGGDTLIVNLYIPADATWAARGAKLGLATGWPFEGEATLSFDALDKPGSFPVALRVPGFAKSTELFVNGKPVTAARAGGYAIVERRWKKGDTLTIRMPLELRMESAPGDAQTVAVLRGPLVLAGDLGRADGEWDQPDPAMVGTDLIAQFRPVAPEKAQFESHGLIRPGDLNFVPFYRQYDRRSAVYFKHFTDAQWQVEEAAFLKEQERQKDMLARSVDVMHLGEMQPERDHQLTSDISYPVSYRGRSGRDARTGGFFEFVMAVKPGPLILQATYWGDEGKRSFDILIDNQRIATQQLDRSRPGSFYDVEYSVPEALTRGKKQVKVRVVPHDGNTAGPVFGMRLFTAATAKTAAPTA